MNALARGLGAVTLALAFSIALAACSSGSGSTAGGSAGSSGAGSDSASGGGVGGTVSSSSSGGTAGSTSSGSNSSGGGSADTQPPTVPSGLASSNVVSTALTLSWIASTDLPNPGASGVGGYNVYRNGALIATATATNYTDSGLTALTAYQYQVAAFDKSTPANVSAPSAALTVATAGAVTISPRNAALTLQQSQQFATNAPLASNLVWMVDGIAGGNSTLGTVNGAGLYRPPATAGTHTVTVTLAGTTASSAVAVTDLIGVTTYHNDNTRAGQNLQEYALTPSAVAGGSFGKRWSCPLDGVAYAQPLYVANVAINGAIHNLLIVVTMHDSAYAFDADNPNCVTLWQDSFIDPDDGITSTSSSTSNCGDIPIEFGITGTPVIDPVAGTVYLVSNTTENGTVIQRLHALNLIDGTERAQSPVVIQAQVAGTGDGGTVETFQAIYENQRPGLVLTSGKILIGWSAHCDAGPWHGWLMSYDATTLAQTAVFPVTPNGTQGGIWMSGGAPAVDSSGNVLLTTGNGTFDNSNNVMPPLSPSNDFGMSFLNLNPLTLTVQDFYTPSQWQAWSWQDWDVSASGVVVLPDGSGPTGHPNVLAGGDKQGHLWLIDRTSMSGYSSIADNTVQFLTMPNSVCSANNQGDCYFASPGYWSGTLYMALWQGPLMAFQMTGGLIPSSGGYATPASQSTEIYPFPSPTPSISGSPSGGTIVWVLDNAANATDNSTGEGPALLRAYDATNLGTTLYSSTNSAADTAGNATKFTLPTVANGHVYIAGNGSLTVYGLAP
jgi:hypothetical protein